jgi:hypothetical protein
MKLTDINVFKKIKAFKSLAQSLAASHQEFQASIVDIPISFEEFNALLCDLDITLTEVGGCDHTFSITLDILKNDPEKELILAWLTSHGARCDCTIIFNVVDKYQDELSNVEDSYLNSHEEEEATEITNDEPYYHLISGLNESSVTFNSEKEALLCSGLHITQLPKPWRIFSHPHKTPKQYQIVFGKNLGVGEKFAVHLFQAAIPYDISSKDGFIAAWHHINHFRLRSGIVLGESFSLVEEPINIGNITINYASIQNDYAASKIGFIYDPANPTWYMVINERNKSFVSEVKAFKALLTANQYYKFTPAPR